MTYYLNFQLFRKMNLFNLLKKTPLCMKLSAIMLFAFASLTLAVNSYGQSARVTLNVKNGSLQKVLDEIEKQSDYHFFYNNKQVDISRNVSIKSNQKELKQVLSELFSGTNIGYKVLENSIILSPTTILETEAVAQQQQIKRIKGTVRDKNGEPIIGANIKEKGTAGNGTITDIDGNFSLSVGTKSTIIVSYIGYQTKEIAVNSASSFNIHLDENAEVLGEVVVTALGIKREEKALGYAVQKVNGDKLSTVKTVNVATSLTGKIAGLNVKNSTEFNTSPSLSLRASSPLLVIDGVPYGNVGLNDIAADDIESIDVLKGATASALYGARGGAGAVMITTKKGSQEGLTVTVNSSTMFAAGYLKKPEVQTSYSTGSGGHYQTGSYVWGDKLDIGRTAKQYDPYTHEWVEMPLVSKGKNNLKNFQELSMITNNNVSVAQKGKYGSVRTSLTHVYNKGQYPNQKLNKITYSVSGDMKWKKFSFEGGLTYNKRFYPNDTGAGYSSAGFLYNLLVWSGTEYDIRDYKDYWIKTDEQQNWMDNKWYDNPYITAYEITSSSDYDLINGYLSTNYDFTSWLKLSLRSGLDSYSQKKEWRNPISALGGWDKLGYYALQRLGGYSLNNDLMLSADHKFGDFNVDGFIGGTVYYWKSDNILAETQNGITIPGYYSLKASVDPLKTTSGITKKLTTSIYGKASVSWKSTLFLDVTARNDWSSTLPSETRSYFYPSVASSVVMSQLIPMPKFIDFWKIRGAWTVTKSDLGVYDTNNTYSVSNNLWNGESAAYYPSSIRGVAVKPSATRSYEIGTAVHFFGNRLKVDFTYYNKLYYNLTRSAGISNASGFSSTLINIDEEYVGKGVELTVSGNIVRTKDWNWETSFNWSRDRWYYTKVDPKYSTQKPWVAPGKRWDWYGVYDWERDKRGRIINYGGYPKQSDYQSVKGYEYPDWIWGWSNSLSYKNVTLSFSFDGRVGGLAHSKTNQGMWNSGAHIDSDNKWRYDEVVNNKVNYIGEGVKIIDGEVKYDSNGKITFDNRKYARNDVQVSYESYIKEMNPSPYTVTSQNVFDQTFFKLRDLSVTYQMPKTVCEKLHVKGLSLAFVGQNLLIWTKKFRFTDPDGDSDNLSSPSTRYLGFNVKLDF